MERSRSDDMAWSSLLDHVESAGAIQLFARAPGQPLGDTGTRSMRMAPLICVHDVPASSVWYQQLLGCASGHAKMAIGNSGCATRTDIPWYSRAHFRSLRRECAKNHLST